MNAFSGEMLDDEAQLQRTDRADLLRALAGAGAQVRRALATSGEAGFARLDSAQPPRAVLVAADSNAPYLSNLLAALAAGSAPVMDWREPTLPRWAGPADALLVVSADGRHPRLAELVAAADRRGLTVVAAAPIGSPVAAAAARHPVADLSHIAPVSSLVSSRALWWALATPALQALDALGLTSTIPLLGHVADALDEVAEHNRPDSSAFTGPAKLLAAELAESRPVIAGTGGAATVAARRIAGSVQLLAGWTAMAAALPDDVARIGALLEFARHEETDIFADRAESTFAAPPRLVLIGDDDPPAELAHDDSGTARDSLGDEAGRRAGSALAGLAGTRGIGVSRVVVPPAGPLVRFAAASAIGDFAATYLALARGIDPSAPRLGELAH